MDWELPRSVEDLLHAGASSVLFLLGEQRDGRGRHAETCLILTKRSRKVRQSGDLCCPGGTVHPGVDSPAAALLQLPGTPLSRAPWWPSLRRSHPQTAKTLALLFATGLREAWEEVRLNPFRVRLLGILPSHPLILFRRVIYPLVAWAERQKRFFPSWEVERIVPIPLRYLLDPANHCRYRPYMTASLQEKLKRGTEDYPCLLFHGNGPAEVLWGATYRIVTLFLQLVFAFPPPDVSRSPFVPGLLDEGYLNGRC
jgi:8-oxo-dGTP pyrophosphatase MutT (NUDIX family)